MQNKKHYYSIQIKESMLDSFEHVNNAMYLTILEEARWDLITRNGYGLEKLMETRIGPTILEINIRFLKELKLGDEISIETYAESYVKKICVIKQTIFRGTEICCTTEITMALFDLSERKIILPTEDWLRAINFNVQ
jgi:acyl-CoA thioester hydrolase